MARQQGKEGVVGVSSSTETSGGTGRKRKDPVPLLGTDGVDEKILDKKIQTEL